MDRFKPIRKHLVGAIFHRITVAQIGTGISLRALSRPADLGWLLFLAILLVFVFGDIRVRAKELPHVRRPALQPRTD